MVFFFKVRNSVYMEVELKVQEGGAIFFKLALIFLNMPLCTLLGNSKFYMFEVRFCK